MYIGYGIWKQAEFCDGTVRWDSSIRMNKMKWIAFLVADGVLSVYSWCLWSLVRCLRKQSAQVYHTNITAHTTQIIKIDVIIKNINKTKKKKQ